MGARSGGGLRGSFSGVTLHGAAARAELHQLNADNFFAASGNKDYARYFDAENAARGFPVVKGSQGLQVGQMAKVEKSITYGNDAPYPYKGKTVKFDDYGKVSGINGSTITITDRGGYKKTWDISHVTFHTKDTKTGFGQMVMKHKHKKFTL